MHMTSLVLPEVVPEDDYKSLDLLSGLLTGLTLDGKEFSTVIEERADSRPVSMEELAECTINEVLPEFPAVVASPESAARIRHGGAVNLPEFSKATIVRVFAGQRDLLAIARRVAGTLFQPKVVLQG